MKPLRFAIVCGLCIGVAHASDLVGAYSIISSVAIEPSADHPQRIVLLGVFAMSKPSAQRTSFTDDYLPPLRGYLYFSLPADPAKAEMVLKEWNDIKAVAGTGKVIAFGGRDQFRELHVRQSSQKSSAPDVYQLQIGVTKVRSDTNYPPIKALLEFRS